MKFSKKGDRGYTSLLGGQRVSKADPRPETYGTLDEVASALGLAKVSATHEKTREILTCIQQDLMILGAELATAPEDLSKFSYKITAEHVARAEKSLEALQKEVAIGKKFILPGKTPAGAAIDFSRTIVRRAERNAVRLFQAKMIDNGEILRFLNRVADLLFVLARYEEKP